MTSLRRKVSMRRDAAAARETARKAAVVGRTGQVSRAVVAGVPVEGAIVQSEGTATTVDGLGSDVSRLDDGTALDAWDAAQRVPVADDYLDDLSQRVEHDGDLLGSVDAWREERQAMDEHDAIDWDGIRADQEQAERDLAESREELNEKLTGLETDLSAAGERITTATELAGAAFGKAESAEATAGEADAKAEGAVNAASAAQSAADTARQEATEKSAAAEQAAKEYAEIKADAAKTAAEVAAALDATQKANAARDAALAVAGDAQTRADEAHSLAGTAESNAQSALTMAGSKARVTYSTAAVSGSGSAGDIHRRLPTPAELAAGATQGDIMQEWRCISGTTWQETKISSQAIANLDVGKLTVGTGIISDLVAQHIAGRTAAFQQVDVGNLFVTGQAAIQQAVIDKLFADVVKAKLLTVTEKIIANDIFAAGVVGAAALSTNALDFKTAQGMTLSAGTITGATIRTAASGRRLQLDSGGLKAYDSTGTLTATLNSQTGGFRIDSPASSTRYLELREYSNALTMRTHFGTDRSARISSQESSAFVETVHGASVSYLQSGASAAFVENQFGGQTIGLYVRSGQAYNELKTSRNLRINAPTIISNREPRLLWSGSVYMNASQSINLAEPISDQLSGIVLVWQSYSGGAAQNTDFNHIFVPKSHPWGSGINNPLLRGNTAIRKYVYVWINRIDGNAINDTAPNNGMVLGAVWGI